MLIKEQKLLNKSNKIYVIHFLKLNDNRGNSTPTNGMGKRHNLRVQVTHSWAYGIVKNDNFLKCAINLLNCSCHPHDDGCSNAVGHASQVTSYNLRSQITNAPAPRGVIWDFGGIFGGSGKPSRWGTNRWQSLARLSIHCEWWGGVNERMGWCTTLQAHKADHQLTSEARGEQAGPLRPSPDLIANNDWNNRLNLYRPAQPRGSCDSRAWHEERKRESDIFSQCTDRGHVSVEGKMTDGKGEYPDMCVSLSGANWLVHSYPDECTTGRAGERSRWGRRQKWYMGQETPGENKQKWQRKTMAD